MEILYNIIRALGLPAPMPLFFWKCLPSLTIRVFLCFFPQIHFNFTRHYFKYFFFHNNNTGLKMLWFYMSILFGTSAGIISQLPSTKPWIPPPHCHQQAQGGVGGKPLASLAGAS